MRIIQQKTKMEQMEICGGNSISPQIKRISQSKRWCFTLNNWTQLELEQMVKIFAMRDIEYIFGKEIGESGTAHLQGYIESKTKIRPSSLKLSKRIHWEKCKGNRASNIKYCRKEGEVSTNIQLPRELSKYVRSDLR